MKRIIAVLLTLFTVATLALPAAADVIYEPGDLFYEAHRNECRYNGYRQYIANGDKGYVYIMKDPETDASVGALSNGDRISIPYIYTAKNGEEWGINDYKTGWVRMSEFSLVYDSVEFIKDHGDECVSASGSDHKLMLDGERPLVAWSYPEGEVEEWRVKDPDNIKNAFGLIYEAPDGVVWGQIDYYHGSRDFWICLSDPYAEDLGSIKPPVLNGEPVDPEDIPPYQGNNIRPSDPALKSDPVPSDEIPPYNGNTDALIIAGVLVVTVVAVTAAVIRAVYVKRKGS